MKKFLISSIALLFTIGFAFSIYADGHKIYGPYPITLKGYDGDKTNSVKYTGQMARQVLHDSLKALVKTGDVEKMMSYYNGLYIDRENSSGTFLMCFLLFLQYYQNFRRRRMGTLELYKVLSLDCFLHTSFHHS